ncbi:MAG TPA: hypothetical protein DCE41_01885 [Cytophagales bacterium]|nr:hypothetical protein [Cytophagales bacterium]HAA20126.1 hypothetical protein [Cytophagales bacterium]HAP64066.1 hypothetical protein [Cytophagales bacterium]
MKYLALFVFLVALYPVWGQSQFPSDPAEAQFITSDIPLFWECFDAMESERNPFRRYLSDGSQGVQDFIKYRIENSRNLLKTVQGNSARYLAVREQSFEIAEYTEDMRKTYEAFKNLFPEAVFPPTYFVFGALNSGGTSSANGLIIGVEMQSDPERLVYIVAHELIHFNQYYQQASNTLLMQSIKEGAADFMGEMISGDHINGETFAYGDAHREELCALFVAQMHDSEYQGWLYGGKKPEGWPNDLGYWMGYQICQSYYDQSEDKKQAIYDILHIQDFDAFLAKSGYLNEWLK